MKQNEKPVLTGKAQEPEITGTRTYERRENHIVITITGKGRAGNEVFRKTVEHTRKMVRSLRQQGICNVSYEIKKSAAGTPAADSEDNRT